MHPEAIDAALAANRPRLLQCFTEAKALINNLGLKPSHQALALLASALAKSDPAAGPGLRAAMKAAIGLLKEATGAKTGALDTVAVVFLASEIAGMTGAMPAAPTLSDVDADRVIQAILERNGPQIASDVHALGVDAVLGRIEQSVEKLTNGATLPAGKVIEIRSYLEDRARWAKPPGDAEAEGQDTTDAGQPVADNDNLSGESAAG